MAFRPHLMIGLALLDTSFWTPSRNPIPYREKGEPIVLSKPKLVRQVKENYGLSWNRQNPPTALNKEVGLHIRGIPCTLVWELLHAERATLLPTPSMVGAKGHLEIHGPGISHLQTRRAIHAERIRQ